MARTQTKSDANKKAIITSRDVLYSDFDLSFLKHPNTKDVTILKDIDAVKQSVKNLILTAKGERPFQPLLGSNIRKLLFEPVDEFTAFDIKEQVQITLRNFEPRVKVLNINVESEPDNNRFRLTIEFQMITNLDTGSVSFYLERIR
jgi:phage baseplate assembly protein W